MSTAQKKYDAIVDDLTAQPNVASAKMMGMPSIKVNGYMFAGFFEDCIVCKLSGADHAAARKLKGAHLFDPSGVNRPMKEWVQIPAAHSAKWQKFAQAALAYASTLKAK